MRGTKMNIRRYTLLQVIDIRITLHYYNTSSVRNNNGFRIK